MPAEAAAELPKPNEISARNLIVLENFDVRDRAGLTKTLLGEQSKRIRKSLIPAACGWIAANGCTATAKPYCPISHQPARFRDPATGMPFASLHAYREMRRLLHGHIRWSCLLDAYVGQAGVAARGVPEGFLGG